MSGAEFYYNTATTNLSREKVNKNATIIFPIFVHSAYCNLGIEVLYYKYSKRKGIDSMTTKEYIVDNCHAAFKAFEEIAERIPCFVEYGDRTQPLPYVSVCITCRNEDLAFVERMIAEFV